MMRSGRELWWFLLLERRYGTIWGTRLDVYLPALLCWTLSAYARTRRSIFLFLFSFVHSLEISPDMEFIVTDCCELAVLRFSTTPSLASGDAMHFDQAQCIYRSQPEQRQKNPLS